MQVKRVVGLVGFSLFLRERPRVKFVVLREES